ncbi:uncharacterized protein SPPG_02405 [Spizellomyces punctatus DAOM BR117]|uniref:Uncharacterized protein n=1 Tax=Spizellomyces punctatus (strain DAOM BR117) TaxID=645134 RepID=A0A0L0HQH9_SPIPD|nr:uncharacterized protein SPPG_02405 [Spizellomyces punctatus DAOM BR117]KND03362.1 hypothetical protein SPPG_02405 [Spizellomyces punctatus DAOM BR117]|eukprot:XP_016611401.1 hypothetical protein SPPG_02405 [Spizellomyces punctatus DAOM BR117]
MTAKRATSSRQVDPPSLPNESTAPLIGSNDIFGDDEAGGVPPSRGRETASNDRARSKSGSRKASPAKSIKEVDHQDAASGGKVLTRPHLQLGVQHRTAMGEYIPPPGGTPLSSLANATPSPQTYTPHLLPSGRCISILGKHATSSSQNEGPGPQKYNTDPVRVIFEERPKWSIGGTTSRSTKTEVNDFPGPGKYGLAEGTIGKDGPSFSISGWHPVFESNIPGPEQYFPPSSLGRSGAPKYSFGVKPTVIEEPTPGPQDYNVPNVPPHAKVSTGYTMRPKLDPALFTDSEDGGRPAPNAYYPKLPWDQKAATLKGWYKESKALKTPGPANYLMPNDLFSGPQFSIIGRHDGQTVRTPPPGPADYMPNFEPTRDKGAVVSLKGRHATKDQQSDNDRGQGIPGPGTYTPRDRQVRGNDGPKVTLKGRWNSIQESMPGPADYQTTPAITPAQLAKFDAKEKAKSKVVPARPFPVTTPGPGSYTLTALTVTKAAGPKFSLGKRLERGNKPSSPNTPGPNAYQANPVTTSRSTTFKGRMSPFVTVFPSTRVDTLRVHV